MLGRYLCADTLPSSSSRFLTSSASAAAASTSTLIRRFNNSTRYPSSTASQTQSLTSLTPQRTFSSLSSTRIISSSARFRRPVGLPLVLFMSSLAVSGVAGVGLMDIHLQEAQNQAAITHAPPATSKLEAALPSSASAAAAATDATSTSASAPVFEETFWDKVRSVWIPTSQKQLYEAELKTFQHIKYPYESRLVEIEPDPVLKETKPWHINTLTLTNPHLASVEAAQRAAASPAAASQIGTPIVVLHGFGAGIGLWLSNFNHFAASFSRVDCIDMLGWGRSTRADFQEILEKKVKAAKLKRKGDHDQNYLQAVATIAEDFTVESLEKWRIAMGHEKMVVVGHSMGGYLSSAYALKYPERVENLILLSPIGVPHPKELNISSWSWSARQIIGLARWGWWSANITPQSIVRGLGRYGNRPVSGYVKNRFAADEEELTRREVTQRRPENMRNNRPPTVAASSNGERDLAVGEEKHSGSRLEAGAALEFDDSLAAASKLAEQVHAAAPYFDKTIVSEYLYHICASEGSGEYAFARLFDQSGFAYKPLIDSLPSIAIQRRSDDFSSVSSQDPKGAFHKGRRVPITFMYGSHDWMDVNAGVETTRRIVDNGGRAQCVEIPKAGHQLAIDNPKGFIQSLKQAVAFGKDQL